MSCVSQYWIRECEVKCSEQVFTVSFKYKGLRKEIEVPEILVLFQNEYTRDVSAQEFKDCLGEHVHKLLAHVKLDEHVVKYVVVYL